MWSALSTRLPKSNPAAPKDRHRQNAFTLVELLMCLVILALLMAILFVALAPVRARGSQTRCLNNLRQIGLALQMYQQDYGGGDPPKAVLASELGLPPGPYPISVYLQPYVKTGPGAGNIFWCEIGDGLSTESTRYVDSNYIHNYQRGEEDAAPVAMFNEQVNAFGDDVIILADPYHSQYGSHYNKMKFTDPLPMLTLHLNGNASMKMMSMDDLNRK